MNVETITIESDRRIPDVEVITVIRNLDVLLDLLETDAGIARGDIFDVVESWLVARRTKQGNANTAAALIEKYRRSEEGADR